MGDSQRSWAIAAAALAVAVAVRWAADAWLGNQLPLVTVFAAVVVAAGTGGWRVGLCTALVGYLAARWLFIDPRFALSIAPVEFTRLGLYVLVCAVIVAFGEAMRRSIRRAQAAQRLAELESARRSEAEARFRLAADAVNGVIYEYDFGTREVSRTRGMFEVLGYLPEEVPAIPEWWDNQVHPDDRESRRAQFHAAADAGQRHIVMRYRMRHKDGRWLHVEDRAVLVRGDAGEPAKLHGCTVDVTGLREADERLRALNEELRQTDRRKDEFVATLAHELRNPLAPIRNSVRILQALGPSDPRLTRSREVIERQVAHMARLLEDLLDVSRISRGKLELRRERVPLAGIVEAAVETSRPLVDAGGHALEVALPPEPIEVDGDPVRLAQVLANLLTNAAKYTERGGRISLTALQDGREAVIRVRDNGIGIAPEMLGRLFEMFSQAGPALARAQGGLGIGLSLAKGIVELHGGSIGARSEGAGRGSEFTVRLPLPVDPAVRHAADPAESGMVRLTRRVLVVDDNRDSADTLCTLLQVLGCETAVAYDGEEALRQGEAFKPDAVLLDLGMPRLNGFEACERMRAQAWGRGTCIIAVTGWGQDEDRRRTKEAGFNAHLVKPADPGKLTELLASISVEHPRAKA